MPNSVELTNCFTNHVEFVRDPSDDAYTELNTTLPNKDGNTVPVKDLYWIYDDEWYDAAWGDYYTDLYDKDVTTDSGEKLADGLCHNK